MRGGIIEYKIYGSDLYIKLITSIADDLNIPVIFNAVGMLDRFDSHSDRARELRKIFLNKNVKFIGVRENVSWMEDWVDHEKDVKLICDPACFAAELYKVDKKIDSNLIGIGLIRPSIFRDYGGNFTDNAIAEIYASIVSEFMTKGYQCELFTNGDKGDLSLAELLFSRHQELLHLKDSIKNPVNAKELVETISGYKMVFSSRMHSAITSYSLDIPCGTLCWADKIKAFYDNIGHSERCFYPESIKSVDVSNILIKALDEEDKVNRDAYLASSKIPIEVVKQLCK